MRTKLLAVAGSCGLATTLIAAAVVPPSFQSYPLNEQTAKLKLVEVAFRHGARTPLSKRPDLWERLGAKWDCCGQAYQAVPLEYVSTKGGAAVTTHAANTRQINHIYPGGCHMGQLTHTGQLQAREFGEWLRLRYIQHLQLLPPTYQEGMLMARTTPYQRTMGTLAGVLTGLLGAPRRNTAPVKAYISPEMDEILYADTRSCPHLEIFMKMAKDRAVELVQQDPDYEWVNAELDRLGYTKPAHHTPKDWFFADLHDVVTALASAGKPIPPGFTPRLVSALNRLATKEFAPTIAPSINDSYGHSMLRLSMGVLLATLVEDMEAVAAQPTETGKKSAGPPALPRMRLYSGHDSTIMPLLSALGCDTLTSWPPFLSNLVFELWQLPPSEGGHHVVKVLYNREELPLPHCPKGQYVTLDSFKNQVLMPFLLSAQDLREACKVPVGHEGSLPKVEGSSASSLVPGGSAE